jgi:hypothetical protein
VFLQDRPFLIAFFQTIHILAISLLFISMLSLNWCIFLGGDDYRSLKRQFRFVINSSLPILLITGSLMIIAEPARSLANDAFQFKIALLITVLVIYNWVNSKLKVNPNYFKENEQILIGGKIFALVSVFIWIGIIFAGRWIAYLM